ncbi:MFS transporter [Acidianus brierleyi]|uniref:MFS transporter n=1 Tax=Acidianus brierleyi TaxID=41673 RepID=A0A2U9IH77_9CREN|nr:MFS transporter [Acidianus brierleyi]AWR95350.1 MFS transporter [Acidianus brierleyi]
MKNLLLGGLLLTVSQWYAFFLISQISLFIFPIVFGVIIFILGFIGRVSGSILFGYIGDKISRKTVLFLTALILVISSILIILLYNYYTIVLFRFLQGLSLGGEWGGASTIIVEAYNTSKFRGFMASIIQLAVPISVILSSFSIFLLSVFSYLGGWRFSLIFIIIISLISFYLIKDLKNVKVENRSKLPIFDALKNDWRNILKAIGIKMSESANFYIFTSYVFAKSISTNVVSMIVIVSISVQLLLMPMFGYLSDVIGRRMVILNGTMLMILGASLFPLKFILGELTLSVSDAALYAPQSSLFTELFDKKYRITASNFSYQLASIMGGSIAPTILRITNYQILIVVLPYIIITLICLALVAETKGKRIA